MKNNLPLWTDYVKLLKTKIQNENLDIEKINIKDFLGFSSCAGDITRVNARFRVAKSFNGIELNEFSEKVKNGYSALIKATLVYSAFESYVKLFFEPNATICVNEEGKNLIGSLSSQKIIDDIRKIDKKKKFYDFIAKNCNKTLKKILSKNDNPIVFLESIRHIFAHGKLTPTANGALPNDVVKICNILSDFFLEIIEEDFEKRVAQALKK